jgi:hypothetical protein
MRSSLAVPAPDLLREAITMTLSALERRIAALEAELAAIRQKIEAAGNSPPWWERIAGSFAHDPVYEEAMKLGRKYRESRRPKKARAKGRK